MCRHSPWRIASTRSPHHPLEECQRLRVKTFDLLPARCGPNVAIRWPRHDRSPQQQRSTPDRSSPQVPSGRREAITPASIPPAQDGERSRLPACPAPGTPERRARFSSEAPKDTATVYRDGPPAPSPSPALAARKEHSGPCLPPVEHEEGGRAPEDGLLRAITSFALRVRAITCVFSPIWCYFAVRMRNCAQTHHDIWRASSRRAGCPAANRSWGYGRAGATIDCEDVNLAWTGCATDDRREGRNDDSGERARLAPPSHHNQN